jgi:D-ribose pyranose/furanose isomerase RbsD
LISVIRASFAFAFILLFPSITLAQTTPSGPVRHPAETWFTRLNQELPLLGHRNWIAVVDSAYPLQTSAGIETLETDSEQLEVVRRVLNKVAHATHVRPVIFTDAELKSVPDSDAPGVTFYRDSLNRMLSQYDSVDVQSLPHEQIIARLDEAGKTFHILVLKTRMTIPYTSVFIRLDCGYWTDEQEKRLRERMGK